MIVQQLSPDLAEKISQASAVLFIDAVMARTDDDEPSIQPIESNADAVPFARDPFSHMLSPEQLLAFTHVLYGRCPRAWQLLIPGQQWDVGEELSPSTQQACDEALPMALHWATSHA